MLRRLIIDNVIVAFELLHSLNKKVGERSGAFEFKLDMSKAYDRVESNLIKYVMQKLGFGENWVKLIMKCVQTISYSIVLDG